jgi:hypothetical protein
MKKHWIIEPDASGNATVIISHRKTPRFSALWSTGPEIPEGITGLCWSDEGSGNEDQIHIHSFDWMEGPPDQKSFEKLMNEAFQAIDEWIAQQM